MTPELLEIRYFFATHPNFNSIAHGILNSFYIAHNNGNLIYLYLA
jgi:hypothetical protein